MNMGKLVLTIAIGLLTSCGTLKESEDESKGGARLREYEASFRPSDYDLPLKDFFPETHGPAGNDTTGTGSRIPPQPPELIQGYRVQIFATSSYDDATNMKETVEAQFPDEWFYLVYDAPTYKLRVGNFIERYKADRFAKTLAEKGYKDAWVVLEKVYKEPPPRPPQTPDQQNLKK